MIMGDVNSEKKWFCGKKENNIVLKGAIAARHHHEYSFWRGCQCVQNLDYTVVWYKIQNYYFQQFLSYNGKALFLPCTKVACLFGFFILLLNRVASGDWNRSNSFVIFYTKTTDLNFIITSVILRSLFYLLLFYSAFIWLSSILCF